MPFGWPLDNKLSGNRWVKYHFADGRILSSREVYWRSIADWDTVVKLSMSIRDHVFEVLPGAGFLGFITYRNVEHTKKFIQKPTHDKSEKSFWYKKNSWLIGWLDATHAHMLEVDFHTGIVMGRPVEPIKVIENHIHPKLKQNWAHDWNPLVKARREKHAVKVQGHL